MLRRYSPRGIETIDLRTPTTLIGSSHICDIIIKNKYIDTRHAIIELHPLTHSYWLRQIGLVSPSNSTTPETLKKESLKKATFTFVIKSSLNNSPKITDKSLKIQKKLNSEQLDYGRMIELHSSDKLRFGNSENCVEYVFEMPPIFPLKNPSNQNMCGKPNSSSTNSSFSEKYINKQSFSNYYTFPEEETRKDVEQEPIFLPIVGNKVYPRAYADRFARRVEPSHRRLCQLSNLNTVSSKISTQEIPYPAATALPNIIGRKASKNLKGPPPPYFRRSQSVSRLNSLQNKINKSIEKNEDEETNGNSNPNSNRSSICCQDNISLCEKDKAIGSHLLQRVVRLQSEVQRRDAEIAQLRQRRALPNIGEELKKRQMNNYYNDVKTNIQNEDEKIKTQLRQNSNRRYSKSNNEVLNQRLTTAELSIYLNELIYNTFFNVCCDEVQNLNDLFSSASLRDYSDMFSEIAKSFQEPFSFRLMEINTKCSNIFENIRMDTKERENLYILFDKFLKDKIYPISKAFDDFLPLLKEAALMSRESIRACTIFSQWSREFGDQLQLQPNWELMAYKVDDLQTRFKENGMSKHWLPPSLVPVLKILIYEYRNQFKNNFENNRTDNLQEIEDKQKELEEMEKNLSDKEIRIQQLEKENLELIHSIVTIQELNELKTENERLHLKIEELQKHVGISEQSSINEDYERTEIPENIQKRSLGLLENGFSKIDENGEISNLQTNTYVNKTNEDIKENNQPDNEQKLSLHTSVEDSEVTNNSQNDEEIDKVSNKEEQETDSATKSKNEDNEMEKVNVLDINEFCDDMRKNYHRTFRNNSFSDTPHNSSDSEKNGEENNWSSNLSSSIDTVKEVQHIIGPDYNFDKAIINKQEIKQNFNEITKQKNEDINDSKAENIDKDFINPEEDNLDTDTESSNTILNNELIEDLKNGKLENSKSKKSIEDSQPPVSNYVIEKLEKFFTEDKKSEENLKNISKRSIIGINPGFEKFNEKLQENLNKIETNPEFEKYNENLQKVLYEAKENKINPEFEEYNENLQKDLNEAKENKINSESEEYNENLQKDLNEAKENKINPEFEEYNENLQKDLNEAKENKINPEFEEYNENLEKDLNEAKENKINPEFEEYNENLEKDLNEAKENKLNPEFEEYNENLQKDLNEAKENKINPESEEYNENLQKVLYEAKENKINPEFEEYNENLQKDLNEAKENKINPEFEEYNENLQKDLNEAKENKINPEFEEYNENLQKVLNEAKENKINPEFEEYNENLQKDLNETKENKINPEFEEYNENLQKDLNEAKENKINPEFENLQNDLSENLINEINSEFENFNEKIRRDLNTKNETKVNAEFEKFNENLQNDEEKLNESSILIDSSDVPNLERSFDNLSQTTATIFNEDEESMKSDTNQNEAELETPTQNMFVKIRSPNFYLDNEEESKMWQNLDEKMIQKMLNNVINIEDGKFSQHYSNSIEFWQLASKLSHILNLEFAIHHTSLHMENISNIDFNNSNEFEIRQNVANALIDKLEETLKALKHSAELNDDQTPSPEYFRRFEQQNKENFENVFHYSTKPSRNYFSKDNN